MFSSRPSPPTVSSPAAPGALLTRFLSPFGRVEPHEAAVVLALTANVFVLLASYYLLKTAREPLILLGGGAEVKTYASAGQALLLIPVTKAFAALARRMGRLRLITAVTLFFASNLVLFAVLGRLGVALGVPFYLWVGVFNVTAIAQLWSFAADLFTPEQGRRLFAIVGIGSSLGAAAGARLARVAFRHVGPFGLMLMAAGLLLAALLITALAQRLAPDREATAAQAPLPAAGGFELLARDRYLQLIGALVLLLNVVNTTGEYLLDRTLLQAAPAAPAAAQAFIGAWKARYFEWVNLAGIGLQLFVVSRVLRRAGVRVALLVLPVVAFGGYGMLALVPTLGVLFVAKVAENGLDYSLQSTTRQALFLPTSRAHKYQGKAVIDTFLVRAGDVLASALVFVASTLQLSTRGLALVNLALVIAWGALAVALGRRHDRLRAVGPIADVGAAGPSVRPRADRRIVLGAHSVSR